VKSLQVGDRVKVYGCMGNIGQMTPYMVSWVGEKATVTKVESGVAYPGGVHVKTGKESSIGEATFVVSVRQCRRLKKKAPALHVWVSLAELPFGGHQVLSKPPIEATAKHYKEFVEVGKK
jgi:hypothetical protein